MTPCSEESVLNDLVAAYSFGQLVILCGGAFAGAIAVSAGVGFALEGALGERRRIFALPLKEGQYRWELLGNLRFIAIAAFAFACLLEFVPVAAGDEDTMPRSALTFVACWLPFEVYYWGMHRLMHVPRFYRFHRYHHESRVGTPLTGYSMSTVESLGWLIGLVGAPLLLGQFTSISLAGLLAYHLIYQIPGNVIGHANVDFFPNFANTRAGSWMSHPIVYHALHHARFKNHYSFGSSFMDRLLGTEWNDWPVLHARVVGGTPMKRLSEQGSPSSSS